MNILDNFASEIRKATQNGKIGNDFNFTGTEAKASAKIGAISNQMDSSKELLSLDGISSPYDPLQATVGEHNDFKYLKGTEQTEQHYIVSVFMDMKGSTQMNDTYDLYTCKHITNTVLRAAIHVCLALGGQIQRIQGDGVFVYFGGRDVAKHDAIQHALTATGMFTYFVKNDLAAIFEADGIDNISTRTGIDFGDDHQVLWASFGVGKCIELTTQGLHTSLASKCQQNAPKNGIVVGQNILDRAGVDEKFFDCIRKPDGSIDYVYTGRKQGIYYKQHTFDWFNYLKSLPYIQSTSDGKLYILSAAEKEQTRIDRLRSAASIVHAGNAHTSQEGHITNKPTEVKNQQHRFHYSLSKYFPKGKPFNRYGVLLREKLLLENHFPFLKCSIHNNVLTCVGWLSHPDWKHRYRIKVEYVAGREPKSTILSPHIDPSRDIHMYLDNSLCLHYPPDMPWNEHTKVYLHTIPWISEWIVFYELYLTNGGKWEGPESPCHFTEADKNINIDKE